MLKEFWINLPDLFADSFFFVSPYSMYPAKNIYTTINNFIPKQTCPNPILIH